MIKLFSPLFIIMCIGSAGSALSDAGESRDGSTFALAPSVFDLDSDESLANGHADPVDVASVSLPTIHRTSRQLRDEQERLARRAARSQSSLDKISLEFVSHEADANVDDETTDHGITHVSQVTDAGCWKPLDTLVLFGGLEGSKQPQDFGVNANFGSRWAANWGFPLLAEYGLGAQIGTSINQTDNAVQVFERVGETAHRTQSFSTVGLFQRYDRWRWGLGYDFLYESYYDSFFLGQWRGRGGYAVTDADEFGIWFTVSQHHDSGLFLNSIPVTLTPLSQGSAYWQHQWSAGPRTMAWCGVSEGHAQANLALGDLKKTGPQFVFGAEVDVPLNRYFAIYGQANFVSPADSGTVDSYLGVAYYPSGHAFPTMRNPFTPFLALANSTMFSTNISR
ncbi:DUF6666 family protein [Schlesneria paludicola]|uniref:DUF6666 family protein n=1 Tax=Schlesneria paludicola TaxID=360056 RepID=UPI00029A2EA2|nr:DUF6666 family protein [Schlesneria paludicola]